MRIKRYTALGSASRYGVAVAKTEENFKHCALTLTAVNTDEWKQAWPPPLLPKEAWPLPQDLLSAVALGVQARVGPSTKRLSLIITT